MIRALRLAVICVLVACATPSVACRPTVGHMTAPPEVVDFFAGGSSQPDLARSELETTWNTFGNSAMWVILPPNGEIVGRLDDKIPPYRLRHGQVTWQARQLDGPGAVAPHAMTGYGDKGFQAGGPSFPTTGCWEVTYQLDGRDDLRFVLRVR